MDSIQTGAEEGLDAPRKLLGVPLVDAGAVGGAVPEEHDSRLLVVQTKTPPEPGPQMGHGSRAALRGGKEKNEVLLNHSWAGGC